MNPPQSFLGGPSYHPQPTPITQSYEPRAVYASPRPTGTLTIHSDGTVCIDARSARLLPEGDNTIDLRHPVKDGAHWHLDCRKGGLCPRRANGASGGIRFRCLARVRLLLGALPGPAHFEFEHVGNDLFRIYPQRGDKLTP